MNKIILLIFIAISLFSKEVLDPKQYETHQVIVEGLVLNKLKLTVDALKTMDTVITGPTPVVCMSGETKEKVKSYEGVKLKSILNKADIVINSGKDFNKIYILAKASDGYEVIFSYNELFNTQNGENVVVFYKKDGKLLEPREGKIALISMDDIKNGARHIKWLEKIVVKKITE